MWLDEVCDLVDGRLPVHREIAGTELLGTHGPTMCTPRIVPALPSAALLGDDLHQPVELTEDLRSAVPPELMLRRDHRPAGLPLSLAPSSEYPAHATSGEQ